MNKSGMKIFVNAITIFRCVFTFVMPFLINRIGNKAFLVTVMILYFTDWIDGFISRKCKVQTLFGSLMDTLADKALSIVLIFCIKDVHWVLFAIMIGEMIIGIMNLLGAMNGVSVATIYIGKVKMWGLAISTITGYMYFFHICGPMFVLIPGIIVLLMQVIVIIGYGRKLKKKEVETEKVKLKRGKELAYALFDTEYYLKTLEEPLLKKLTIEGR